MFPELVFPEEVLLEDALEDALDETFDDALEEAFSDEAFSEEAFSEEASLVTVPSEEVSVFAEEFSSVEEPSDTVLDAPLLFASADSSPQEAKQRSIETAISIAITFFKILLPFDKFSLLYHIIYTKSIVIYYKKKKNGEISVFLLLSGVIAENIYFLY